MRSFSIRQEGGSRLGEITERADASAERRDATCCVPVVMAADLGYLIPTIVALDSIYRHSLDPSLIEMYLIVPEVDRPLFEASTAKVTARYGVDAPCFLEPAKAYDDAYLGVPHISSATYYRLALPDLLPHLDRCVYLDGDIIVCNDLLELVDSLQETDLIAGVRAAGYYWPDSSRAYHQKRLELPEFDTYVNAGVLVMNLRLMRELDCVQRFDSLVNQEYESQDQDILNKVCYSRIRTLPPKFNLMTKYGPSKGDSFERLDCLKTCYGEADWKQAQKSPSVIHYADKCKPWTDDQMDLASVWWEQAEESLAYVDVMRASLPLVKKNLQAFDALRDELRKCAAECSDLEDRLSDERQEKEDVTAQLNKARDELAEAGKTICAMRDACKKGDDRIAALSKESQALQSKLEDVYVSWTWRLGRILVAPAAAIKRFVRKMRGSRAN